MRNDTYLYTDGLDAARRSGQIALWRASHQANIACKKAIEDSIRQGFDGVHLKEDCAKEVLEEFGFKRVNWVLANTIQEKSGDGRFRPDNRSWAQRTFIPEDMGHKVEFIVNSHSEVVNGFVNQVRDAYQKLNLFGPEHCEPNSWEDLDYAGKVLVLSPDTLREGEDILASDYKQFPLWADVEEVNTATQACISTLRLRYVLHPDAIVPIPKGDSLSSKLKDKYLWLNANRAKESAITLAYRAGTGWIPLREWKRCASKHPLILKFMADGLTEGGAFVSLEVEPWEYDLLVRRTLERLNQNTSNSGGMKT